ncbi:MAG: BatD family protein, partial [Desulfatitalea sp.]|nr:BatD family protein [Desulfatitalea sp.]
QAADAPEVWAEAVVSQPEPFVGQQITYTISLYQAVQIANASLQAPGFEGFGSKEIPQRGSRRELINGHEHVITQIHYVLVPLAAGDLTIEPAGLHLGIVRPAKERRRSAFDDFFNDPMFGRNRVEPKVIQAPSVPVRIKPLPPLPPGIPAFSGLIGRFDLAAAVEKSQLKVGDSTTLTITLQGQGNLMDAQAPALPLPEGLKGYADAPQEEIQLDAQGYNGRKVFRTALVPVRDGRLPLPPVQWTYFDVEQGDYRTLSTTLPELQVAPAEGQAAAASIKGEPPEAGKRRVEVIGRDILPLKEDLAALRAQRPMSWVYFMLWMVAPALAYGALFVVLRLRRVDQRPAARMRFKARQALKLF